MVRDLGVLLDNTLSVTNHISSVAKSCCFHLRRIRCLNEKCQRTLVQALVISRLDYCNTILINLPDTKLHPYTTILHSAAHLVKWLRPRDHITLALWQLHWLPIKARISFKICVLIFNIHSGLSPRYMSSLVMPCKSRIEIESLLVCQRRLRNPAHVQLIWSTGVRRCWSIRVEQSPSLPPSRVIYRIIQNQTKSHLLQICYG